MIDGGNFVTKVIYLPDPKYQELAVSGVETLVSTRLEPGVDPILEADKRGTILLIVRLGAIDLETPGLGGVGVGAVAGAPVIGAPVTDGRPGPARAGSRRPAPAGTVILDPNAPAARTTPVAPVPGTTTPSLPAPTTPPPPAPLTTPEIPAWCRDRSAAARADDAGSRRSIGAPDTQRSVRITFRRGSPVPSVGPNINAQIRKPDDEPPRKGRPRVVRRVCVRPGYSWRPRYGSQDRPPEVKRHQPIRRQRVPAEGAGAAVIGPGVPAAANAAAVALDGAEPPGSNPTVQVVRFQGPPGLTVEVLAPDPVPVPKGDGGGIITVGLVARRRIPAARDAASPSGPAPSCFR